MKLAESAPWNASMELMNSKWIGNLLPRASSKNTGSEAHVRLSCASRLSYIRARASCEVLNQVRYQNLVSNCKEIYAYV